MMRRDQAAAAWIAARNAYPPERTPSAKVRAFIDFIADAFTPEPPWDRGLT